jgi:hypothetical protein
MTDEILGSEKLSRYTIGALGHNKAIISRPAKATILEQAMMETREISMGKNVQTAWLRKIVDDRLGPILVMYIKGVQVQT